MATIDPVARFSIRHHGADRLRGVVRLIDRATQFTTRTPINLAPYVGAIVCMFQPDDGSAVIPITVALPNGGADGVISIDSVTPISQAGALDIRHASQTLALGRVNLERDTANG